MSARFAAAAYCSYCDNENRSRQTRHGPSEGSGVAQISTPLACQLAGKQGGTCIFWPRCFYWLRELTRLISPNPGSMEEYGLPRGTCFVARRIEMVEVAGLLWSSWWVLSVVGFRFLLLFLLRTLTACYEYEATFPHFTSLLRTGCHHLVSLVCLSVCVYHSSFFLIARAVRRRSPQMRDLCKRAGMGQRVRRASSHAVPRWSPSLGCCGVRGLFWVRRLFLVFSFLFFELRTQTSCCK